MEVVDLMVFDQKNMEHVADHAAAEMQRRFVPVNKVLESANEDEGKEAIAEAIEETSAMEIPADQLELLVV